MRMLNSALLTYRPITDRDCDNTTYYGYDFGMSSSRDRAVALTLAVCIRRLSRWRTPFNSHAHLNLGE